MDNKEESHVKKIVDGGQLKGPSTLKKLADLIFAEDPEAAFKSWKKSIFRPGIKRLFISGIESIVWGQPMSSGSGFTSINDPLKYSHVSSGSSTPPSTAVISKPVSGGEAFNNTVYFEDTAEESAYQRARNVYEEMLRIIAEYKWVRLAELYEIANIPGIDYVSNAYGWSDLSGTNIYPSGKGYILQLPSPRTR